MHIKLQLVLCSDDGHEETVTDIVSWNKDYHSASGSRCSGQNEVRTSSFKRVSGH